MNRWLVKHFTNTEPGRMTWVVYARTLRLLPKLRDWIADKPVTEAERLADLAGAEWEETE